MATEENTKMHLEQKNHITGVMIDVIEEILVRLPASYLLRFRTVCKQWNNIISDPHFIMKHAQYAPPCLLVFLPRVWETTLKPSRAMIFDEKLSLSTWASSSMDIDDHLFASCNGLLCFYKTFTLKIANPATGECLHLSKPGRILKHDFYYLYSFGFHPTTREYKLIHFLREPEHYNSGQFSRFNIIQVYTLGEDKWREIRAPELCCLVRSGVVNMDGSMYWLTEDKGTTCGIAVMSFDLKDETFTSIQPPPLKVNETDPFDTSNLHYYITKINRKVCVATASNFTSQLGSFGVHSYGKMEVWMLESQTEHKWVQKYSIQLPFVERYVPRLCFIHREKILLLDLGDTAWCHDLPGKNVQIEQSREVKLLNFSPARYYKTQSYLYKKTLVPLDIYSGAAIAHTPYWPYAPPAASH